MFNIIKFNVNVYIRRVYYYNCNIYPFSIINKGFIRKNQCGKKKMQCNKIKKEESNRLLFMRYQYNYNDTYKFYNFL